MLTSITGINWGDEGKGRMSTCSARTMTLLRAIRAATMQATPSRPSAANSS